MWQPIVDKMQRKIETERIEQAEKNIQKLKDAIAELKERIKELEKKEEC